MIRKTAQKGIQTTKYITSQFRNHAATAIIAAFSFLIALSWKDFIVKLVQDKTKIAVLQNYPYIPELITATIVTIIAIIGIAVVSKWARKSEEKQK